MKRLASCFAALLWSAGMVTVVWAATITVRTGSYYFEDATVGDGQIVARVGDRLQFLIEDSGKGTPHTIESDPLGIHSGPLGTNSTYTTPVLSQAGTFLFYCKPHQNKGHYTNVVVLGAATPVPTQAPTPAPVPTTAPAPTAPPTSAPTAAPTSAPTATAPSGATTMPSGATTTPASTASGTNGATPSPRPSATQDGPANENTVARSGGGEVIRAPTTTWFRSVFVGLLALVPVLGLAGLAGWLSSRRRSS